MPLFLIFLQKTLDLGAGQVYTYDILTHTGADDDYQQRTPK